MNIIIMPVFYEFGKVDKAVHNTVHQECLPNMILLFRSKQKIA